MQVWSNDRYPAPVHRVVVNADAERYSAPFFFNSSYQADIAPLVGTSEIDASENPRYHASTAATIGFGVRMEITAVMGKK